VQFDGGVYYVLSKVEICYFAVIYIMHTFFQITADPYSNLKFLIFPYACCLKRSKTSVEALGQESRQDF